MARSLSYAAYRALSRRRPQTVLLQPPARPEGELIWAHATSPERLAALSDLGRRLKMMRPGTGVLLTHVPGARAKDGPLPGGGDWVMELDSDHPATARQFLAHWHPDFGLWTGGTLMPNVIAAAAEQKVPLCIVDLSSAELQAARHKWLPDLTRSSLDLFDWIMVNNQTTARTLRRMGIRAAKVAIASRLRGSTLPPACADDELDSVIHDLAGRPVWISRPSCRMAMRSPMASASSRSWVMKTMVFFSSF